MLQGETGRDRCPPPARRGLRDREPVAVGSRGDQRGRVAHRAVARRLPPQPDRPRTQRGVGMARSRRHRHRRVVPGHRIARSAHGPDADRQDQRSPERRHRGDRVQWQLLRVPCSLRFERVLPAVVGQPRHDRRTTSRASGSAWCWCYRRPCARTSRGPTCNVTRCPGLPHREREARGARGLVGSVGRHCGELPTGLCSYPDLFGEATLHAVRADDGVHLTQDGARRTAEWTAAALRQFWTGRPVATG